jgi:Fe-S cluster assembly protein SufD
VNMIAPKTTAEEALGMTLPSRRDEDWKWTDLKRLIDKSYGVSSIDADAKTVERLIASAPLSSVPMQRVVVVNGKLQSSPQGLSISANAPDILHTDPLLQLNSKLNSQIVSLAFNGNVDQPVEVLHVTTGQGAAIASRLHISIAPGAAATVIETFVGEGEYLNNPVTTIEVAEGGRLDRIKIETEAAQAQHLSHTIVSLAASASLNDFVLTAGAILNRQNANIDYNGENSSAKVSGAYLLKGSQHADTCLVVDHKVPHCLSRELFKCVMDEKSRGIFQGKVIVRKDAQKIDGKQSSHALLLSETAEFDAKPELEIYADDVVCGHGTTCGDLDHDHLFYLKSRGIPEKDARAMLVHAFVGEAIETVENEAIREALDALTTKLMTGA